MEQYEAMLDSSQHPAIPNQQNAMSSYQVPIPFPQFSVDNDSMSNTYGNLSAMTGSYPTALSTPGGNLNMGGYNPPGSQPSPYTSTSGSFSMPYDPPTMQSTPPSLPMPTPPPPSQPSTKPIYSCTYCGLVLSSNNALIEHKRIHTGERPYACHICDKRFTQKAHLNIHKRIHTGEKPYACHICHKRFAQSSHLSSHKRIHTGEKPFVCGICHIGFTQKQRLDAHLKKHMERPGEDINVGSRRSTLMMAANQAQIMDRMEAYRQSLPRDDAASMMHMVGQGMPYIKQESGIGEVPPNHSLQAGMDYKALQGRRSSNSTDDSRHTPGHDSRKHEAGGGGGDKARDERGPGGGGGEEMHDRNNDNKNGAGAAAAARNPNIGTPSFSSEGMFLHPSGYVAYGGIEDNEGGQQSPRAGPSMHPAGSAAQQNLSSPPGGGGHRRKSSFVRKRQSESPDKGGPEGGGGGESGGDKPMEATNGLSRFHALNQDGGNAAEGGGEEEDGDENGDGEEFKDTGETLDDKNDPPYPGTSMPGSRSYDPHGGRKGGQVVIAGGSVVETRSHARRTSLGGHEEMMVNGDRSGSVPAQTLSYAGPTSNPGLVKVNSRISLVNFTADELITHLIKRDDVHCCQFCSLIFQDAAMYHIHRNMHDKQDIRKCNMCGKTLQDKYDFTAHFLSMHQN